LEKDRSIFFLPETWKLFFFQTALHENSLYTKAGEEGDFVFRHRFLLPSEPRKTVPSKTVPSKTMPRFSAARPDLLLSQTAFVRILQKR
jgi:hypothetical protein